MSHPGDSNPASGVRVISSMATRSLLADLIAMWQDCGGGPVVCESVGGVDAAKRVAGGEAFDVVVLSADAIDRLADSGHVRADAKIDLVLSSVAIAIREGDVRPSIADEVALRAAVLAAGHVALSTGPSGDAVRRLFARWGIVHDLGDRLVEAAPGVPVGQLIAGGVADLGFQQLGELQDLPGIVVLGPMPPGLEITTTFSAACCTPVDPRSVMPMLEFWNSPSTADLKRRHGMSPMSS